MITTTKQKNVEQHGEVLDSQEFGINEERTAHLMQLLRDMYSRPWEAAPREYVANAVDAHVEVGKHTVPVEVTLPYQHYSLGEQLQFKVRDYGPGLSKEDTVRLLFSYGSSGDFKMNSNDAIGGFGVGSKCGYAIADQFMYTIYHEGICRIWNCYLDENDAGKASLLSETKSDEPSGVEVSIPIEASQVYKMDEKMANMFAHLPVPVQVTHTDKTWVVQDAVIEPTSKGSIPCKLGDRTLAIEWARRTAKEESNIFASKRKTNATLQDITFVVGGYEYQLDASQLGNLPNNSDLYGSLEIKVPVGFVPLAPNRESIKYTRRAVRILEKTIEQVAKAVQLDSGDASKTLLEQFRTYSFMKPFYPEAKPPAGCDDQGIKLGVSTTGASARLRLVYNDSQDAITVSRQSLTTALAHDVFTPADYCHAPFEYLAVVPKSDSVGMSKAANKAGVAVAKALSTHKTLPTDDAMYATTKFSVPLTVLLPEADDYEATVKVLQKCPAVLDGSLILLTEMPPETSTFHIPGTLNKNIMFTAQVDYYGNGYIGTPRAPITRDPAPTVASRKFVKLKTGPDAPTYPDKHSDDWEACLAKDTSGGVYAPIYGYRVGDGNYGRGEGHRMFRKLLETRKLVDHGLIPDTLFGVKTAQVKSIAKVKSFVRIDQFFRNRLIELKQEGVIDLERMVWWLLMNSSTLGYKVTGPRFWFPSVLKMIDDVCTTKGIKHTDLYKTTKPLYDWIQRTKALGEKEQAAYELVNELVYRPTSKLMLDTTLLDDTVFSTTGNTAEEEFVKRLNEEPRATAKTADIMCPLIQPTGKRLPLRVWTGYLTKNYPPLYERITAQAEQAYNGRVLLETTFKDYVPYITQIG
jgi:hypothetical protein